MTRFGRNGFREREGSWKFKTKMRCPTCKGRLIPGKLEGKLFCRVCWEYKRL